MSGIDDGGVHAGGDVALAEDNRAVGTAQRFGCREGHNISERHGRGQKPRRNESDALADIHPEIGVHGLRYLIENAVVYRARITHRREDDETRTHTLCVRTHLAPVDLLRRRIDAVILEHVREPRAVIFLAQVKRENAVARLEQALEDDPRGGGDTAEPHNRMVAAEQRPGARLYNRFEVNAPACCLVVVVKDAIREDAPLEIRRER